MKNSRSTIRNTHTHRRRESNSHRRLWLIGLCLILLLIGGYSVVSHNKNESTDTPSATANTTPVVASLPKDVQLTWPTNGQAAVGSVEDGLLAQSSDNKKPRPIASMAKVIAALAVMKKQPLTSGQQGPTYTVTNEDIQNLNTYIAEDGSVLPLRIGMKITQYQAMQRMLIASDNNMADMLTERVFDSKAAYVSYAQKMLKSLGLSRTVVADASGFSSFTVSTPSELVMLGIAALKDPVIAEIVSQQQAESPGIGTITNTNQLLGTDGVIGIKTGTTDEAGSCLLFAARYTKDGQTKTIVAIIMGDTDHGTLYNDSRTLLVSIRQAYNLEQSQTDTSTAPSTPSQQDRTLRR